MREAVGGGGGWWADRQTESKKEIKPRGEIYKVNIGGKGQSFSDRETTKE